MTANQVFTSMSTAKMAALIARASQRVVVVAPSVRTDVADALLASRLLPHGVTLIVDCDEEVFRLGLGDVAAIRKLRDAGCVLRQCSGLRVGVLICDDRAWVFAPTALYVQNEVHSDETPNAVELSGPSIERFVASLVQSEHRNALLENSDESPIDALAQSAPEIGQEILSGGLLKQTEENLSTAPPVPFDVARQVRVFQPYIQYVEISLTGCAIQRRRIEIPKSIQKVGAKAEIESRLRTTFDLIEKKSAVSSQSLERELKESGYAARFPGSVWLESAADMTGTIRQHRWPALV